MGIGNTIQEGVLGISGGPNYESVAELKMFFMLGVDCIGMSSIPECLVAHHCGMEVLAFSLVTNQCSLDVFSHTSAETSHQVGRELSLIKKVVILNFSGSARCGRDEEA